MVHSRKVARLEQSAGESRDELAADLADVRAQADSWKGRATRWLAAAAAIGTAAAIAAGVARRTRRQRNVGARVRKAAGRVGKEIGRHEPRPIPVTILFVLLRTPAVRRALAAAAGRLLRGGEVSATAVKAPSAPDEHRKAEANRDAPPEREGEEKAKQALESLKRSPFQRKVHFVTALFRDAFRAFLRDEALTRAAALAYYTILSLAPLLIVVIAVAGIAFGAENVRNQILGQIAQLVGQDAAKTIAAMMQKASKPSSSIPAAAIGVATLLFGAGGVFGYLHDMLNKIWAVPEKKGGGIWRAIQSRFLSLAMVLGTGFLMLVSLVVSAALAALGDRLGNDVGLVLNALHQVVSWAIIGLLFALIFRFLPDTRIAWRDVWIGAGITSLLFVIGQFLIGLYLGRSSVASVYGGAGSLLIVLLWTYYSGLILFFGAEVTQVFANEWGSRALTSPPATAGGEDG